MTTKSFTTTGSHSWTAPDDEIITIRCWGAGGGRGGDGNGGSGGSGGTGGYIDVEYTVSANTTYTVWVGEAGENGTQGGPATAGGTGWYNGGDGGGSGVSSFGAGGAGGSPSVFLDSAGNFVAVADAGGGGAGGGDGSGYGGSGGGGGARGGIGGNSDDSLGEDGGGSGFGGDGGDGGGGGPGGNGGDGGTEYSGATLLSSSTGGGNGGDGEVQIVYNTAPKAPSSLTASANTEDQVDLSWTDNSPDESQFNIYRAQTTGSGASDYTLVDTVTENTTSYTDTGLEDGEKFFYRVSAEDSDGESPLSNEATVITVLPVPTLKALDTSVGGEIAIFWSKEDDTTDGAWEIYRSTDGTLGTLLVSPALDDRSYTDTSVTEGTEYFYTVRRVTDHTQSDSQQKSGVVKIPPPSNVTLDSINGDQFVLSWTDNATSEDGYRVYVSRDSGQTWTKDSGDLSANTESYTTTNLLDGEEYQIVVSVFTASAEAFAPGLADLPQ